MSASPWRVKMPFQCGERMSGCCATQMHRENLVQRRLPSVWGRLAAAKPTEHEGKVESEEVMSEKRGIDVWSQFSPFFCGGYQSVQFLEDSPHYGVDTPVFALNEREFFGKNTRQTDVALVLLQHNAENVDQLIDQCPFGDLAESALDTPAYLLLEHHYEQGFLGFGVEEQGAFCDVGQFGDFTGGRRVKSLGQEELARRSNDALAFFPFAAFCSV
jgi:hypothetical protein